MLFGCRRRDKGVAARSEKYAIRKQENLDELLPSEQMIF